jgi:hypothetical protein
MKGGTWRRLLRCSPHQILDIPAFTLDILLEPILKREPVVCWASIAADITAPIGAYFNANQTQAFADDLACTR